MTTDSTGFDPTPGADDAELIPHQFPWATASRLSRRPRVAVEIDWDNLVISYRERYRRIPTLDEIRRLIHWAAQLGSIVCLRAYANWIDRCTRDGVKAAQLVRELYRLGIDLVFAPSHAADGKLLKNSADVRLVTDSLERYLTATGQRRVDIVVLVSGDGDFAPLVEHLRRHEAQVFAVGIRKKNVARDLLSRVDAVYTWDDVTKQPDAPARAPAAAPATPATAPATPPSPPLIVPGPGPLPDDSKLREMVEHGRLAPELTDALVIDIVRSHSSDPAKLLNQASLGNEVQKRIGKDRQKVYATLGVLLDALVEGEFIAGEKSQYGHYCNLRLGPNALGSAPVPAGQVDAGLQAASDAGSPGDAAGHPGPAPASGQGVPVGTIADGTSAMQSGVLSEVVKHDGSSGQSEHVARVEMASVPLRRYEPEEVQRLMEAGPLPRPVLYAILVMSVQRLEGKGRCTLATAIDRETGYWIQSSFEKAAGRPVQPLLDEAVELRYLIKTTCKDSPAFACGPLAPQLALA